jgi:hypothetical protein
MQTIDVIMTCARPRVWHPYYVITAVQICHLLSYPELAYGCKYFYTQIKHVSSTHARPLVWHPYYVFAIVQIWHLVSWPELAYGCEHFYTQIKHMCPTRARPLVWHPYYVLQLSRFSICFNAQNYYMSTASRSDAKQACYICKGR